MCTIEEVADRQVVNRDIVGAKDHNAVSTRNSTANGWSRLLIACARTALCSRTFGAVNNDIITVETAEMNAGLRDENRTKVALLIEAL